MKLIGNDLVTVRLQINIIVPTFTDGRAFDISDNTLVKINNGYWSMIDYTYIIITVYSQIDTTKITFVNNKYSYKI